jgi:hypothetical protein
MMPKEGGREEDTHRHKHTHTHTCLWSPGGKKHMLGNVKKKFCVWGEKD